MEDDGMHNRYSRTRSTLHPPMPTMPLPRLRIRAARAEMMHCVRRSLARHSLIRHSSTAVPKGCYLPAGEVTERVLNVVKTIRSVPPTLATDAKFADMGFDSMIRKELWTKFEDEFCVEVPPKDADTVFVSVAAVSKYFSSHPKAR